MSQVSSKLRGVLWSRRIDKLQLERDKDYIIHQILAYGSLGQIKWLFKNYTKEEIRQTFLESPRKSYTPSSFNFVKNYLLNLKGKQIDPRVYVKTIF